MMEPIFRVLIVDDEPLARQRLVTLLTRVPAIEIVGECQHGLEAVASDNGTVIEPGFRVRQKHKQVGLHVRSELGTGEMAHGLRVTSAQIWTSI